MGSTNDLAVTLGIPTKLNRSRRAYRLGAHERIRCRRLQRTSVFIYLPASARHKRYPTAPAEDEKPARIQRIYDKRLFLHLIPALADVKPRHIKIEYDGNIGEDDFYFGSFSNSTSVAGLFKFDKDDVKLDDGLFELLLVRKLSNPLAAFNMLHRIMKRDFDGDSLIYIKASEVKLTFEKPEIWTLDGGMRRRSNTGRPQGSPPRCEHILARKSDVLAQRKQRKSNRITTKSFIRRLSSADIFILLYCY